MKIIRSRQEYIDGPVLTDGSVYNWYTAYFVQLPALLEAGTVIQAFSTFEVTNPYPFNVQLDAYISLSTSWGSTTEPIPFNPVTGTNVTPGQHHWRDTITAVIDDNLLSSMGLDWQRMESNYLSLMLSAVSDSASPGEALILQKGYGELVVCLFPPQLSAPTTLSAQVSEIIGR